MTARNKSYFTAQSMNFAKNKIFTATILLFEIQNWFETTTCQNFEIKSVSLDMEEAAVYAKGEGVHH